MTTLTWARTGLFASLLLVGLEYSAALAKKPPKPPPEPPPPPPILYEIEWLPVGTKARDAELVYHELVVVGTDVDWDPNGRAFLYNEEHGTMDLTTLVEQTPEIMLVPEITLDGITLIRAGCINDLGQIAGIYVKYEGNDISDEGIYVWDPYADTPTLYTRSLPGVSRVYDISDGALGPALPWDGTVVGKVSGSDGTGFVWQPAQDPNDEFFGFLPIDPIYDASGINRDGVVVGRMPVSDGYVIYRYTLGTGELTGEPTILSDTSKKGPTGYRTTGEYSWGRDRIDINDYGVVAGNIEAKRFFVPALYMDETGWAELTLDSPGYPVAINNAGQVCGITPVNDFDIPDTGFVDHPQGGYWSLNDLIDLDDEDAALWFSGDARDKCLPHGMSNDDITTGYGTIVGYKWLQASGYRGFVLRPHLPPPSE